LQPHLSPQRSAEPVTADAITSGAAELGLQLSSSQSDALARYAALLLRWNAVHNLTAIQTAADVLSHHLLDSLAIVPEVQHVVGDAASRLLDVGSGGGLPGVALAIAAPNLQVTLVDKVQKKIAFLTQVKVELGLDNVDCVHSRVETLKTESRFELIVARAFASLTEFTSLTRHLLVPGGWWFAMKGALPTDELNELKRVLPDVRSRTVRLDVPRLNAERHLVLMQIA
jgi:16S rRNA (guanine527-N7)-methyltransferase